jgi:hypothetical protein
VRQAPYLPQCGAPAATPHGPRLRSLPAEEQYAAMELFRGSMTRHSVVAHRRDHPAAVDFAGSAWRRYTPVRAPDTIAVRENLPPGAAAVLINRTHSYTDIYLPVDAAEERLLNAVDGRRTIAEIALDEVEPDVARDFFQRLWNYDQVVFDASASRSS